MLVSAHKAVAGYTADRTTVVSSEFVRHTWRTGGVACMT